MPYCVRKKFTFLPLKFLMTFFDNLIFNLFRHLSMCAAHHFPLPKFSTSFFVVYPEFDFSYFIYREFYLFQPPFWECRPPPLRVSPLGTPLSIIIVVPSFPYPGRCGDFRSSAILITSHVTSNRAQITWGTIQSALPL